MTKAIICISLCLTFAFGLGVTSFADVAYEGEFYATSQAVSSFKSGAYYADGYSSDPDITKALGYFSYDLNHIIPNGQNGSVIETDSLTSYTPVDWTTRLDVNFTKSVYPTADRAFFYYTGQDVISKISQLSLVEFASDLFVYDQSKTQGEFRTRTNWATIEALDPINLDGLAVYAVYTGYLYFPVVGGGGYERISFQVASEIFEPVIRPTSTSSFDIRASIVPCKLATYNTFDKLNLYEAVYSQAPSDLKLKLKNPSSLTDETCVIENYVARLTCSYYEEAGSALITPGRTFAFNGITTENAEYVMDFIPRSYRVGYSMPITPDGLPRQGETLSEFLDSLVYVSSTVDISDFDWFAFVRNSFTGILELQILPGLYVYHIVGTAICIPLLLWVLKAFAGG